MATLIRFRLVEVDSQVSFVGRKKKVLKYLVRSISLVPEPTPSLMFRPLVPVPEIFWQ